MATTAPQTRHTVTAVIVAHDGSEVLPSLFRALATQTYPVERVVGVDTGSQDHSGSLLRQLVGPDAVLTMPRDTGFGEAVAAALSHHAATRALPAALDTRRVEWVWLLHDDCEPAPDALERLVKAAGRDRTVVVLGPKVLDAADRRTLRETGISIDRAGRRITGIDTGEIDQGQHDGNRPVLAVGSAGMLVRRDVWDRLGGFDPRLNLFRDDLDFCWRAHGAGHRVQVVTDAVLYHRELSARRRRGGRETARRESPGLRRLNRRNALYVLAVNLPLPQMLLVLAGCVAGSLLRALWFLLTKQKDLAQAHAFAVTWLLLHPFRLWQSRRDRAEGRRAAYNAVHTYIPSGRTLFRLAEGIAGLLSSGPPPVTGGRHQAVSSGTAFSDKGEAEQFTDQPSLIRRVISYPAVQLVLALTIVALVAERRLLGTSPLGGGALVPAWGGGSGLWSEYLAGFHAVGLGSSASAPPYLAVVAALSSVLGGQAWLAVDVLLLGCVPLAGITAYLAARRLVTSTAARVLLAAMYALLPVAIGAIAAGRLGTAVAFIVLPLIAVSAGRMLTSAPRAARRAAWATGLLVALAAAFAPVVWLIAALLAAVAVVVRRWLWPVSRIDAAIVVAAPFLLLFPWSLHLLGRPSALLADTGLPVGHPGPPSSPGALLLLSPGGPGLVPLWVTAGLALAIAGAFLPHGRRLMVGTGWTVAAAGYLIAIIVSRTAAAAPAGGTAGAGWPGTALAVTATGLLLAAAPAAQWLCGLKRRQVSWAVLGAAAVLPVLAAAFWVTSGVRGPVAPQTQQVLPAFVAATATGPGQYRTLVLRPAPGAPGAVSFSVLRGGDPSLGEPELGSDTSGQRALGRQVSALVAADRAASGDPAQELGSFGIRWVLLPDPVDATLAQRLNASSGLVPLSSSPAYDLWQVSGAAARARVVAPDGTVTVVASQPDDVSGAAAPASGGTLILAEPYGGWTATLNGSNLRPLPRPVDGWAQGFVLPRGGGTLGISRDTLARTLSLILELAALLVIGVLAIPGRREDPAEEAEAIAAVRAAQHERRVTRAAKTRELTRSAAVRALESEVARRAVPGIVASLPSGLPSGSSGRSSGATSSQRGGVRRLLRPARLLREVRRRRAPAVPPAPAVPLALPPVPDASTPSWETTPSRTTTPSWETSPARETASAWQPAPPWEPAPAVAADPDQPDPAPGPSTPVEPARMDLIPLTPPERQGRAERGAHRGGRHGKPRGRRKDREL